jgi:uncharacterized radical SAM superfamily Fe-S cluster-containing enzyme
MNRLPQEGIIYRTLSLCPQCTLLDRSGVDYVPAHVEIAQEKVWLKAK